MKTARFCKKCGKGYVFFHMCEGANSGEAIQKPAADLPPAWLAITKIFTQELCAKECEWSQPTSDPFNTGDTDKVVTECTVPTPRQCPSFDKYVKENS